MSMTTLSGVVTARARMPAFKPPVGRVSRLIAFVVSCLIVVFGVGAFLPSPPPIPGVIPAHPGVEQRFGVRLTQLGVTADGGLVDVRYLVLDPAKASELTQSQDQVPRLIVENGGAVVWSAALMGAHHDLEAGRTAFLLYRNTGGVIQRGTVVTVTFGDALRIEHVVAQ